MNSSLQFLLQLKWTQGFAWDSFVRYSQKNVDKMRENYERTEVSEELSAAVRVQRLEVRLLVLGADWCGDAVANVPSIARLASLNDKLQLRALDRDRHDDLMQHFLTNGGKAIPKVIVATPDLSRFEVWGPRPAECQRIMTDHKDKMPKEDIYPMIRAWYEKDRYQTTLSEIWGLIQSVA